jgi:exoribonuclease-2
MADQMIGTGVGVIGFLLISNVLLLIAGNFMEPSSIVLILAPILFPIAMKLGIDPVHFGIIMVVNMEVGMCHPPVGLNLYVASGITKMGITELTIAVWPWLLTMLGFLVAVTYWPLPEPLSTDLSSLNPGVDRLALVTEMVFNADATLAGSTVYRALVRNQAQLAYDAISAWLDGKAALPAAAVAVPGMDAQLRTQDAVAQQLRTRRHAEGALEFETFQPRAVFAGDEVVDIRQQEHNRARQLIEEVMIATNGCTARYLAAQGGVSLRRVVRSPERWLRIVGVAKEYGDVLPPEPDSKALEAFLAKRRQADPLRFPDVSLVIVKLMGRGEYVVEASGALPIGHFGLAVQDYTHSTAPNRRFPDLITLRMLKAALAGQKPPYSGAELEALARHCTRQEDAAQKVERQMRKSEAALVLESHVGQYFDAIVTGVGTDGIWVRVFTPPAEGKLVQGNDGLRVGDKVRVTLIATNVEHGFIDFALQERTRRG